MSLSTRAWLLLFSCTACVVPLGDRAAPKVRDAPVVAPLRGSSTPLLDREAFYADDGVGFRSLSRDGAWMLYTAASEDGSRGLFLAPFSTDLSGGRRLIDNNRVEGILWTRDHRYLVLFADERGTEDYHVHALDLADQSAQLRDLTPLAKAGTTARECASPIDNPGHVVVLVNDRDPELSDVYDLDLASGKRTLIYRVPPGTSDVVCDRHGRPRVLDRTREDGETEILRIDGTRTTLLQTYTPSEYVAVVAFPSEHTALAVSNRGPDRDRMELVELDLRTGEETVLHRDPENAVDIDGVTLDPVTLRPLAAHYEGDRSRVYPLDDGFGRAWETARAQRPDADMWIHDTTDDLELWIVGYASPTQPPSYYEYRPGTGAIRKIVSSFPDLDPTVLAPTEPIRYQARDGHEITGYVTTPRGHRDGALPLVVVVHGGPWARDRWAYDPEVQFLANRGYAVLQPNYRGSTGFGKAFMRAGFRTWGTGAAQHDVTDGVAELVRRGIADVERVCIYGGSYGGYAVLAGLAFTPDVYVCGISVVGPSNLVTLIESFPASVRNSLGLWFRGFGDPSIPADRKDLEARSPLFAVDAIEAPLLLAHGVNDPRVKKSESDRIAAALRSRRRDVRYLVADDEGHGFYQPINRTALYAAMEQFLGAHLGGRVQVEIPDAVRKRLRELEAAGAVP